MNRDSCIFIVFDFVVSFASGFKPFHSVSFYISLFFCRNQKKNLKCCKPHNQVQYRYTQHFCMQFSPTHLMLMTTVGFFFSVRYNGTLLHDNDDNNIQMIDSFFHTLHVAVAFFLCVTYLMHKFHMSIISTFIDIINGILLSSRIFNFNLFMLKKN